MKNLLNIGMAFLVVGFLMGAGRARLRENKKRLLKERVFKTASNKRMLRQKHRWKPNWSKKNKN